MQTAIKVADSFRKPVAVIGEDTDLLILLLHLVNKEGPAIYMFSDKKSTKSKTFFINEMKIQLGERFCENVLFMDAFLGCDTTSRIYSIGKGVIVKKFIKEDLLFQQCAEVFNNSDSPIGSIIYWGEKAIISLYNGADNDTLDLLRLSKFHQKTSTSSKAVGPHVIPPTTNAFSFHSLRVYQAIHSWKENTTIKPEDFGLKHIDGKLLPVMIKPIVPAFLLNIFRCGCKGDCDSKRCSCFKNGLECTNACSECRGNACLNSPHIDDDIEFAEDITDEDED